MSSPPISPLVQEFSQMNSNLSAASLAQFSRLNHQPPQSSLVPQTRIPDTPSSTANGTNCNSPESSTVAEGVDRSCRSSISSSTSSTISSTTLSTDVSMYSEDEEDQNISSSRQPSEAMSFKAETTEELSLESIKRTSSSESLADGGSDTKCALLERKKRGRPRRLTESGSIAKQKIVQGRSKTGCITCRRRKKKCDERKPGCLNCHKNNVCCEGYAEKRTWQAGKKASRETKVASASSTPSEPLTTLAALKLSSGFVPRGPPSLFGGIEDELDNRLLNHFYDQTSLVLAIGDSTPYGNPFRKFILPLAFKSKNLMHAVLALAGSHMVSQVSDKDPSQRELYASRKECHLTAAINEHKAEFEAGHSLEDSFIASMLIQCLIFIADGLTDGEHRRHMAYAQRLIADRDWRQNPEFYDFIYGFFKFHIVAGRITSLPTRGHPSDFSFDDSDDRRQQIFMIPLNVPRNDIFAGVLDGLFKYISKITNLRDTIRARRDEGLQPVVAYESLSRAAEIDCSIRSWEPREERYAPKWIAAQLYRQATWVYLNRTIKPSRPDPEIRGAVQEGIKYLKELPPDDSTQCILLLPIFILSCAAFDRSQRPDLKAALDTLEAYSHLRNIQTARKIIDIVWDMMDRGDRKSWDWETIMAENGWDLLLT